MPKIFVKPAVKGAVVRHPEKLSYVLPEDGDFVEESSLWQRKLMHGEIIQCDPPQAVVNNKPAVKPKLNKEGE